MGLVTYTNTIANGGACDGDQVMQDFNDVKAVVEALDESNLVSTAMIGQFEYTIHIAAAAVAARIYWRRVMKGSGILTNAQYHAGGTAAGGNGTLLVRLNGVTVNTFSPTVAGGVGQFFDSGALSIAYNNGDVFTIETDGTGAYTHATGPQVGLRFIQQKG